MDRQTSQTFVAWFFLCIVLTLTNVMPVANVAHAVGAGMGALLGLAGSGKGLARWGIGAAAAAVVILCVAGSTVFWPWVNLSKNAEPEVERAGLEALLRSDGAKAIRLLEISARMRGAPARAWYNLGIAYQRLGRDEDAVAAYERAAAMPDATSEIQKAAEEMRFWTSKKPKR